MEGWKQGREWRAQPKPQMGDSGPSSIPESIYESLDERWSQVRQVQDAAYGRRARLSSSPPPVHVPHARPGGGANSTIMDPSRLPMSPNMSRGNPRQIQIERKDNGFGFTLRHFIVYPPEEGCDNGPPITEPMDTIFVKSVKEMGPAVKAGLNIGDRIVSVNGETVSGRSYAQVVQLIQKSRDTLFLVVVPREDDILQVYFSEIAQNPESNRRDGSQPPLGSKPHWPGASVCSSSSRESSPFSSKTSDSTRDSVYGHNRDYPRHSRDVPQLQHDAGEGVPRQFASQSIYGSLSRPPEPHWTQQIQDDKLLQVPETEHVYAVVGGNEPFWGAASSNNSSSSNTLGSGSTWPNTSQGTWPGPANSNNSRESLDSDNSAAAGFNSRPDESLISKIKKDTEMKEEFLKNQTYPAYLSSPPKEVDTSPYGIANLSSTMPPSRVEVIRNASPPKKENTPVAGYQRGRGNNWGGSYDNSYDDAFSRNNFVIVGSRTLHCEPPQVYQPTIPRPPVCVGCYSGNAAGTYCGGCHYHAPVCPLCVVAPPIAPCCSMMTMTTPYQPRPPRPSNLPGIQPLQAYGYRGRHEGPTLPHHGHGGNHGPLPHHGHGGNHTHYDGMVASSHVPHGRGYAPHAHRALPPLVTTPVQMHPDPLRTGHKLDPVSVSAIPMGPHPDRETHSKQVVMRKKAFRQDNEEERNLRRISYLQATKEDPMDVEDNLTGDSGLAPTHSIKKLKSIFSEKASENQPPSLPPPPSPRARELKPTEHSPAPPSAPHSVPDGSMEGYLTCKVAVVDGKKAIDRSWKTVYVILKQSVLYMYKDKKLALANPDDTEEKPVKLNETEVAVADDYTKRKNVFRVKTEGLSEYLFQAEDEELMKNWVQAIDAAAMAVIVDERKDANKLRKLTSFRNRSPTGQSPSNKSRKSSTDTIPPFKDKDKKNWKGKVVKQLKKMGGGSHGPLYPEGGSVGVPLEECPLCPASPDSESDNIPYLVKICCDIVNERGLDIIGIYRVPGNNAAVTYLTDLINKGQEHYQLDDHRWQDVNVVSSLLKSFFRKLPDPLFTMEMYSLFIDASKLEQPAKRLDLLRKLIRDLPEINYETLKYLCAHLCNVVEHSCVNKMEIRNLAIVFGPTLVRTSDDNMVSMVTDMSQQCRIIESILSNNDFFFNDIDEAVINDEEDDNNLITGVGNQTLMLANLAKLEDAGKVQSPKNDMSTKDIVTSIISAANRKMLRSAAGSKGKKESLTDYERSEDSRASESRRDSESVLHGALQIASAVPGLIGPMATSEGNSGRDTPDIDFRQFYGRQSSRGSISGDLMGMGNLGKRRGSLPVCQSKRGSICEYSGGAMCESTPVGELCETRMAIMQVATHEVSTQLEDTFTNGEGSSDNQEVVTTGKLSLNVSGVVQNTVSTACAHGPRQAPHDHDDTQTSAKNYDDTRGKNDTYQDDTQQDDDTQTNGKSSKFPIETYAGLDAATAERIKKFEAETKAMLTRPVAVGSSFSRSTQELSEHSFQESSTGSTSLRSSILSARMSGLRGSPLTTSSLASLPRASNSATSLPRASNSVTSLPKASSSVASLPKSSSSANNSVANLPRSRHSLASNSTASLPRASSVSSSSSVRASISSVSSLEPLQPSDHSKIRASISSVGSLEPLQSNDHAKIRSSISSVGSFEPLHPNDPAKIRASISSAGSLEQPFEFTKLRQEPVQPTQPADPSKCRLTTPDPDPGPLDGGMMLQEPYPSDQLYPAMPPERRFLSLSYRTSLPNLPVGSGHCPAACAARRPSLERPDPSADFDTKKIMSNGTLMRLKQRRPDLLMEGGGGTVETIFDCGEERELEHMEDTCSTEKLLSNLTVSFDQKMRLLLDPNYQSSSSSSSPAASRSIQQMVQLSHSSSSSPAAGRSIQQLVQHSSSSSSSSPATSRSLQQMTQQPASSCSSPVSPVRYPTVPNSAAASHTASPASASLNSSPSRQVLPPDSFPHPFASLSAARNLPVSLESQQAKMSPENKKELDEARNIAQQVRQSSKKVELRRGGRVDKHTEPVLRQVNCRKERVRRSDSLTKKEKTELNQLKKRDGREKENKVAKLRDHFERGSGVKAKSTKIDVNKLRKKLSERNNRRIKRRHTVGGTKDFGDGLVNGGRRNGHTAWDRLQPLVTDEELNVDRSLGVWLKRNQPASRRLSLPDSAAVSAALKLPKHMESHV